MEQVRLINCSNIECDNWEEFPVYVPRTDSQNFTFIEHTKDNQALYKCPDCGEITESIITVK